MRWFLCLSVSNVIKIPVTRVTKFSFLLYYVSDTGKIRGLIRGNFFTDPFSMLKMISEERLPPKRDLPTTAFFSYPSQLRPLN